MSEKNLKKLVNALASCSNGWDGVYQYTCKHSHGDGTQDDITEPMSQKAYASVPERVKRYSIVENYDGFLGADRCNVCQTPAYFMQALADIITTSGGIFGFGNQAWKILNTYQFADRYEGVRTKIVSASTVGGISDPHYCETYYIIINHTTAANFH